MKNIIRKNVCLVWISISLLIVCGCRSQSDQHNDHQHHSHENEHSEHAQKTTRIADEVAASSGIKTAIAQPQVIKSTERIRGKIVPSEHRIAHIIPRFAGVVREGKKHIGDRVEKGEVLAVIESNESLQPFEVRSQIAGTVINGHVIIGEFVPQNQWIYIVADLSEVWADFFVPLSRSIEVRQGQTVVLSSIDGSEQIQGAIAYVAPYADEKSQSRLVRAVVANPNGILMPGMFVVGGLVVQETTASVAVRKTALQTMNNAKVIFVKRQDVYQARTVELGKADEQWVEVLNGISEGEEYVSENSFLLKADILKSAAGHDH